MSERKPSQDAIDRGHEAVEFAAVRVLIAALGVLVTIALALAVDWGTVRLLAAPKDTAAKSTQSHAPGELSSAPGIEPNQAYATERQRQEKFRVLHGYGWIDGDHAFGRIPIEEAIKIIGERGLTPLQRATPKQQEEH